MHPTQRRNDKIVYPRDARFNLFVKTFPSSIISRGECFVRESVYKILPGYWKSKLRLKWDPRLLALCEECVENILGNMCTSGLS
jgi:hypothetical protein